MKLLIIRNSGGSLTFIKVGDDIVEKIKNFDSVKAHHVTGNFNYTDPKARYEFALNLLGLTHDRDAPFVGENIYSVYKNSMTEIDMTDVDGIFNLTEFC